MNSFTLIAYDDRKLNGEHKKYQGTIVRKYEKELKNQGIDYIKTIHPKDFFKKYPGRQMVSFEFNHNTTGR